jgi:hypothetical protein
MISARVQIFHIRCLVDFARTYLMACLLRRRLCILSANTGQTMSNARQRIR